jgi:outer membrane lipoprotein-sorting protein
VMKRNLALSILFVPLAAAMGVAQTVPAASADSHLNQSASAQQPSKAEAEKMASARQGQAANPAKPSENTATNSNNDLSAVLAKMNQTAHGFKSAQADFEFQNYQELLKSMDDDPQTGRIYFRRNNGSVDAAFEVSGKAPKQVVYKNGKLQVYEKKINQVTERMVGKNKADVEAFLSLGFGATGDDLVQAYDVKMLGWETVDGIKTAKLDLTPKNEKMRQTYTKILLWVDPEKDVLLKQQFFEKSGDYRLAHYTNVKRNADLPGNAFNLKTSGKVTTIQAQ